MTYKEFEVLYTAQLNTGILLNHLLTTEYPDQPFIDVIERNCYFIGEKLGKGYFEDSYWLKEPLSPQMAFQVYLRQKERK